MDQSQITVKPWEARRHRSAIEAWPAADLPSRWQSVTRPAPGPRQRWAIEQSGQLVGSIALRPDMGAFASHISRLGIYLHPHYYGQGIGSIALRLFFAVCPVDYLRLDVSEDNKRAVRCYEKVGFQILYYFWMDSPIASIEMERHIDASDRAFSLQPVCSLVPS